MKALRGFAYHLSGFYYTSCVKIGGYKKAVRFEADRCSGRGLGGYGCPTYVVMLRSCRSL